ncbi:MAG: MBOAT family protein [Leptospiraceae bacterium]|nr:MBOAT family protein [Leptospiraceae bacterium]MCP5511270.1 MBOAT family protein [Leptospiraceae bacterium]
MSFLSLKFFLFFLFSFYVYWFLPGGKARKFFLVLASSIFYSFFSFPFLIHFLSVLGINYWFYHSFREKSFYTKLVVVFNVFNLLLFKYFYFLLGLLGSLTGIEALSEKVAIDQYLSNLFSITGLEIALPATISYYSFQLISFGVDYRAGKIQAPVSVLDFFAYCLFFPIMIAGPILRYSEFLPGYESTEINSDRMVDGFWLIAKGLFKKAILSDGLTSIIYPVFGAPETYSGSALLVTTYFFGLHLFLDFSGLTDIARGLGTLLGFQLPENFKAPFFMTSFGDFWRRWHLTFSFWIRDYIYIPLGGSRKGEFRTSLNYIVTFTLGGLWHGANLNFAVWGFVNGFYLAAERFMGVKNIKVLPDSKFGFVIKYLIVLHLSIITWIFFFTGNVKIALTVVWKILTLADGAFLLYWETGIYTLILSFFFHLDQEFPDKFRFITPHRKYILPVLGVLFYLVFISRGGSNIDFYYTKF